MIRLNGIRMHGRLYLSGVKTAGVNLKKIPPYFSILVDEESIIVRKKGKAFIKEKEVKDGKYN